MSACSERILKYINESGFSYGELSKITGIPKSALQRYATGETEKIPLNRLESIAKALKVDTAYLLGWQQETIKTNSDNGTIKQSAKNGIALIGDGNYISYQGDIQELSSQTYELVRIYSLLNPRRQIKLMSFAYKLEEEENNLKSDK